MLILAVVFIIVHLLEAVAFALAEKDEFQKRIKVCWEERIEGKDMVRMIRFSIGALV